MDHNSVDVMCGAPILIGHGIQDAVELLMMCVDFRNFIHKHGIYASDISKCHFTRVFKIWNGIWKRQLF